jgi:hypothetical protein
MRLLIVSIGLATASALIAGQEAPTWVEDSYADFADGELEGAGHNLYVAAGGTVRTIQRFDLNQDGHLDLIFNSTHDLINYVPATLATVTGDRGLASEPLAVDGSIQVAITDLNRDGYADAVFCPNASGIQHPRRFLTILWGARDGWSARRSTGLLPVNGARAVAIADLNRDAWPDIVVLGDPEMATPARAGTEVRIYWGGAGGFLMTRRAAIETPPAVTVVAGDFDRDGGEDVAVVGAKGSRTIWAARGRDATPVLDGATIDVAGQPSSAVAADLTRDGALDLVVAAREAGVVLVPNRGGRAWGTGTVVARQTAGHLDVADLDADRHPDIVATGEDAVTILWGGDEGFADARSSSIPLPQARASAAGDLDGDGVLDLAVAVYQGESSFTARSAVLFGRGSRQFERARDGVETAGAAFVAIAPRSGPAAARAIFCNSMGGTRDEAVPLQVYWGGPDAFSPTRRWEIPFRSGYEASAADLDADGYPDLIAMNSQHLGGGVAGADPRAGANIFWGSAAGFDDTHRSVLGERNLGASAVADLDRDGYLDLVLGAFDSVEPGRPEAVVIRYGSPGGIDRGRRVELPSEGRSLAATVADFNRDGWLDIGVTSYARHTVRVFWGAASGFEASRQSRLDVPSPIDLEAADLDADGYLDLVTGSYGDPLAGHHDTGLLIFWGGPDGFRASNAQGLPGFTPIGLTVADFDADGFLDLFAPSYHAELTRESLPSFLYWGGPDGFSPGRRTTLMTDSGHDAAVGDFDLDGRLDLAVSCHTRDGDHHTVSKVFFGDGQRFTRSRVLELPTHGTHWMWLQDMGNIATRRWEESYVSSVFAWDGARAEGTVEPDAAVPPGTRLELAVRSAASREQLSGRSWTPTGAGRFELAPGDRVLQYRVTFRSDNGDRYPVLDRVSVELAP